MSFATPRRRHEGCGGQHFPGNMSVFGKRPLKMYADVASFSLYSWLCFSTSLLFHFPKALNKPRENVYFSKIRDCISVRCLKIVLQTFRRKSEKHGDQNCSFLMCRGAMEWCFFLRNMNVLVKIPPLKNGSFFLVFFMFF